MESEPTSDQETKTASTFKFPPDSIPRKIYLIGRLYRRGRYLVEKNRKKENPWELAELEALRFAIKTMRRAVFEEIQLLKHFTRRMKEVPGSESNGENDLSKDQVRASSPTRDSFRD